MAEKGSAVQNHFYILEGNSIVPVTRTRLCFSFVTFAIAVSLLLLSLADRPANAQSGYAGASNGSSSYLTYTNSTYGIKVNYPSDWVATEKGLPDGQVVAFFPPASFLVQVASGQSQQINPVGIYFTPTYTYTLNNFTGLLVEQNKRLFGPFASVTSNATTLAGSPASRILTAVQDNGTGYRGIQVVTIVDSKAYTIQFFAPSEVYSQIAPTVQKMADSLEVDPSKIPTVKNSYANPELGITIKVPPGWMGYQYFIANKTSVTISPPPFLADNSTGQSHMDIQYVDNSEIPSLLQQTSQCSFSPTAEIVQLNDKVKALHWITDCNYFGERVKTAIYQVSTKTKVIFLDYSAPPGLLKEHLPEFDNSAKTLQVQDVLDASDFTTAPIFGEKYIKQTLNAGGPPVDLQISTTSNLSNFEFNQQDKKLSFAVDGRQGTWGDTVLEISKVMRPPYTVTMDNQPFANFTIITDRTVNETSIELDYKHSSHIFSITGAAVVPEFSSSLAGPVMAAAILAAVVSGLGFRKFRAGLQD